MKRLGLLVSRSGVKFIFGGVIATFLLAYSHFANCDIFVSKGLSGLSLVLALWLISKYHAAH